MSKASLKSVTVERFKSFQARTRVEIAPLTIILGRNNSGKSSLIQSLLLLKQTLMDPRPDVTLRLEGLVEAFNARELTYGWPPPAPIVEGPAISLEWDSLVNVDQARETARWPDMGEVARNSSIDWLRSPQKSENLRTRIDLRIQEVGGITQVSEIHLWSKRLPEPQPNEEWNQQSLLKFVFDLGSWKAYWQSRPASKLDAELQHFIPFLNINRRNLGPRHEQRAWHTAYLILFAQPLSDLSQILTDLHYLGSSRQQPPPLYKTATSAPNEVGVSGELAAQLLHRRQRELVHFLPPLGIDSDGNLTLSNNVRVRSMVDSVNEVMGALGIDAPISIRDIHEIGFQLMLGNASLIHVGRGLNSLLPLVELGLLADPLRFTGMEGDIPLERYLEQCTTSSYIALEEPEAHLHPKVASRLAHWLVSLAKTNRYLMVETHSDHLVRRLRGLAARSGTNSELEQWLINNVLIVAVEQQAGQSSIRTSRLTSEGGVSEVWPADFMDESTDEESAIYYARLEKTEPDDSANVHAIFEDGAEPEPDEI